MKIWDRPTAGGLASPEIVQAPDGTYVVVLNSHTYDLRGSFGEIRNKLYYQTSRDLRIWSPMKRLAENIWSDACDRVINAAIAYTEIEIVLAAKREQTFYLALSPTGSLDGPWQEIGKPKLPGLENYQIRKIEKKTSRAGHSIFHVVLLMGGEPVCTFPNKQRAHSLHSTT